MNSGPQGLPFVRQICRWCHGRSREELHFLGETRQRCQILTALLCFSSKMHEWDCVYWSKTERADQVGWGIRQVHGQTGAGAWKNRFLGRQRKEEKGVCPNWKSATKSQGLENVSRMSRPDGCLTRGALGPGRMQRKTGRTASACRAVNTRVHELDSQSHKTEASEHSGLYTHEEVDKRSMKVAPRGKKRSRRVVKWVGVWGREARKMKRKTVARDIFLFNG